MTTFLTILVIYVMIGLILSKAALWYMVAQDNTLTRTQFLVYWFSLLIIGQFWLPIISIILYHSRRKKL